MSRSRCKDGACIPRLPPTTVVTSEGTVLVIYCERCGHIVRMDPPMPKDTQGVKG